MLEVRVRVMVRVVGFAALPSASLASFFFLALAVFFCFFLLALVRGEG